MKIMKWVALGLMLTGCATNTPDIKQRLDQSAGDADAIYARVNESGLTLRENYGITVDNDGIWVNTSTIKSNDMLPKIMTSKRFSFIKPDPMNLAEIAAFITQKTGIKAERSYELLPPAEKATTEAEQINLPPSMAQTAEKDADSISKSYIVLGKYTASMRNGTIVDFLDHIAASLGISWKYSEETGILFYYYDTQTFYVHTTISDVVAKSLLKNTSNTSNTGSGGESDQTIEVNVEPKFWDALEESLEKMVTEHGEVVINASTGAVTVTDNDLAIRKIKAYITDMNRLLKMQVHMRLMIVTVEVNAGDMTSLSYDLVYNNADGFIKLTSARLGEPGLSGIGGGITNPDSRWKDSKLFLDALSTRANISTVTTSDILVSNYRPYHYRNGGTMRYVGNVNTTVTSDVGVTESVEIQELFTGIGIIFQPNIYDKENVNMDLVISQQDLAVMDTVELTNTKIKLPETSNQDITNNFHMRSGETRVLVTFEKKRDSTDNKGTLTPDNMLLGGSKVAEGKRELVLLVGTPRII